jgi:hypothetical protein
LLTSLAAAAAIALAAGTTSVGDLPRIANGVETSTRAAAVAEKAAAPPSARQDPQSRLGVEILGSTMAGGTGCPWVRDSLYEKQSDARAMNQLKDRERKNRTITNVLIGIGISVAAGAVGMIASGGGGSNGAQRQAQAIQAGAAGPRGAGAAFVWKVGFR